MLVSVPRQQEVIERANQRANEQNAAAACKVAVKRRQQESIDDDFWANLRRQKVVQKWIRCGLNLIRMPDEYSDGDEHQDKLALVSSLLLQHVTGMANNHRILTTGAA